MPPAPLDGVVVSSPEVVVSSAEVVVSSAEGVVSSCDGVVSSQDVVPSDAVDSVFLVVTVVDSFGTFVVVVEPDGESLEGPATAEHTPEGNSSRANMRWLLRPMDIFCSITWNCSVTGSK